ncbi:MAG: hypothetical protein H0X50_09375 [Nitrosopumilus sp.]|nr:hypothetical protein [Nitrosopumilus sp.]
MGYRGIEKSIIRYCAKQGIDVMEYSPFGHNGSLFSSSSQSNNKRLLLLRLQSAMKKHQGRLSSTS